MEPELGRDATVAIVLIAAIVAVATGSIELGVLVLAGAIAVLGVAALIHSRVSGSRCHSAPGGHPGPRGR